MPAMLEQKIVDKLDMAIENAVMRIDDSNEYAVLFSGGLDSSLLVKVLEDLGKTPILVSVAIRGSPDFTFIKEAAGYFTSRSVFSDIRTQDLPGLAKDVITATGEKSPLQVDIGIPIYAACKAAKDNGASMVVAGQGADELFGGYHRYLGMSKNDLETALLKDLINIEQDNLRRDNAIAAATGVRFALPYLDREVVSLARQIPVELKIKGGIRKYILREVAKKRGLPDAILNRGKKAIQYSTGVDRGLREIAKSQGKSLGEYLADIDMPDLSNFTPFQKRVMEKVRQIPRGRVSTYKEVARAAGSPDACRAVGSIMAKNPFPIVIPCHRVVKSDMSLGSYSGGTERKKQLLEEEGVVIRGERVDRAMLYRF